MNYDQYETEEDLEVPYDLLLDTAEREGRVTSTLIHDLSKREDCFVLTRKKFWSSMEEFNADVKKVTDRKMNLLAMILPPSVDRESDLYFKIQDDLEFYTDVVVEDGDVLVLIGSY